MGDVYLHPAARLRRANIIDLATRQPLTAMEQVLAAEDVAARAPRSAETELILALLASLDDRTPAGRSSRKALRSRVFDRIVRKALESESTDGLRGAIDLLCERPLKAESLVDGEVAEPDTGDVDHG